jgi:hypothetical protein
MGWETSVSPHTAGSGACGGAVGVSLTAGESERVPLPFAAFSESFCVSPIRAGETLLGLGVVFCPNCWESSEGPIFFAGIARFFCPKLESPGLPSLSLTLPNPFLIESADEPVRPAAGPPFVDDPESGVAAADDVNIDCANKLFPRLPAAEILLIPNPYLSNIGLDP